ncbi:MAG: hypothetical protein MZW92_33285 [Comamonadaceae bacterium]|nr:hypothetical protein [Comamonadaceae bacterium]
MIEWIDIERLRGIGLAPRILPRLPAVHADDKLMRVAEVQRDGVTLHDGAAPSTRARAAARAARGAGRRGRRARRRRLGAAPSATRFGEWWVHARVPPLNQLARRLHDGRDKVDARGHREQRRHRAAGDGPGPRLQPAPAGALPGAGAHGAASAPWWC